MAKTVQVVHSTDIGKGLAIEEGKLIASVDGVTITIEGGKLVAKQPEATVDLHVTKIEGVGGKLVVTVADAQGGNEKTVETSLASLIALSATEGNLLTAEADGIYLSKRAVTEAVRMKMAEELVIQDLAGNNIAYAYAVSTGGI